MKARHVLGLLALAAFAHPALAQTTPGAPINANNPTAPVLNSGTVVPGQPAATPPLVTPPGTVYSAPSTKKTAARKRTTKTTKSRPAM